ncbi:kinase-interacting protein 1 [Henckelia pumila]|uniref:kinase-interacting protein 1 n=1 Tax=Henckelia pumila TaxID=405737 RepID=UPI003C6E6170
MLQRAANNAYSWWWASHIRTKQSKWLEQSLQDMEEKVQSMLKLIEEDGDSFAKRAEMYYKRRPELINSVEESYRAFRALADRYDHLSKDLQNANRTIATVFPEQIQFAMEEDEDCASPKTLKKSQIPSMNMANVPTVPKAPIKDFKGLVTTASKQLQMKSSKVKEQVKSGFSKEEALKEVDKLQKDILASQTVKEFVKSSYENGLAKYWEIESQIIEMQQKVCSLQDEFNMDTVIDDDEARTLMAGAALKSCQEMLAQLQENQEKAALEAREEFNKIEDSRERLKTLRNEYLPDGTNDQEKQGECDKTEALEDKSQDSGKERIDALQGKTIENLDLSSMASMTVSELAEKIDELVNKVLSLETSVSSQTVLINTLKTEAGELHEQIRGLEDEKGALIDGKYNLRAKVKELEEKLNSVQDLNKNVERQNSDLETNFSEALLNLDHLSEKLGSVKPDEEAQQNETPRDEARSISLDDLKVEQKDVSISEEPFEVSNADDKLDVKEVNIEVSNTDHKLDVKEVNIEEVPQSDASVPEKLTIDESVTFSEQKPEEHVDIFQSKELIIVEAQGDMEKEEGLHWQKMLLSGVEDREKILLKEYTALLRNFKEVKKKLSDMEKREKESQFDTIVQMREFKKAILKRDEEIQHMRQRLNLLLADKPQEAGENFAVNEDSNVNKEEIKSVHTERTPSISAVEEKFRTDIDAILDENLDFWLRFSTAFHQIQKFKTEVQDLQDEISKLQEKKKQGGSVKTRLKSEVLPIYKHLREIQTELTLWLEQSASLKDELKRRFASLCGIQEDITKALKDGAEEEEIRFSSHQAAKFQGEILNMKQENNKVREELETGLEHVSVLKLDIEKTLGKLHEDFDIPSDQPQLKHNMSKSRIPLRSFIFGTRQKKQKHSIFSYMHPNRRYQILKAGVPVSNPDS